MKILLVSHKYPPYSLGGVEVYARHLARALGNEHEVAVFFRHDSQSADDPPIVEHDTEVDGVRQRRVALNRTGLRASAGAEFVNTFLNRDIEASFSRLLAQFRPDLVHFQHVMALSARLLPIARTWGVPTLLTLNDYWFLCSNAQLIWPDEQPCRGKAWGMNCVRCAAAARFPRVLTMVLRPTLAPLFAYRDRVVRVAALSANQLVSPSHFLLDRYAANGFPRDRLTFLEYGLPVASMGRTTWHLSPGPLRVTFLGAVAWQKGVHVLIEAFQGLYAARSGAARLRIWGDPTIFPAYAARLQKMLAQGDADAALMGRVANERVGEVLADSDVVVVPSLWYENSPVVIQEARAAGVPVVASNHGALAEKVRDGVDGLLFTPGDAADLRRALQRLIDEPGLLAHLRENVPAPVEMGQHLVRLFDLYQQVVRQRS